jgi:DNA-binding GntR family transcriptional regulator
MDHDIARAIETLEEDIVLGRLHPRERITEDGLLERFGLKRHVVREVLASLDRMGLVERKKNIGAVVRSFSQQEVMELYAMRELLETEAAKLMPLPVSAGQIEQLMSMQREHDTANRLDDLRRVFRANLAFHHALFSMVGNQVLQRAIDEYARQTHSIRFSTLTSSEYRNQAKQEHWQMIEALKENNRATLVTLCREHLLPARDAYLALNRARL